MWLSSGEQKEICQIRAEIRKNQIAAKSTIYNDFTADFWECAWLLGMGVLSGVQREICKVSAGLWPHAQTAARTGDRVGNSRQNWSWESPATWRTGVDARAVCWRACCSVLQCVAVCCSVLQCVAVCCSVCSVLQCVAVYCSVLQSVAKLWLVRVHILENWIAIQFTQ